MTDEKLAELHFRRDLCKAIIKMIDEMPKETEGRQEALVEYKRQLRSIEGKIEKITGTPPPVKVGLKTAKLFGRSDMSEGDNDG